MAVLFSVVKIVGQVLEILFVVENSWNDFLYGLGVGEIFWILLEDLLNREYLSFLQVDSWALRGFLTGSV